MPKTLSIIFLIIIALGALALYSVFVVSVYKEYKKRMRERKEFYDRLHEMLIDYEAKKELKKLDEEVRIDD